MTCRFCLLKVVCLIPGLKNIRGLWLKFSWSPIFCADHLAVFYFLFPPIFYQSFQLFLIIKLFQFNEGLPLFFFLDSLIQIRYLWYPSVVQRPCHVAEPIFFFFFLPMSATAFSHRIIPIQRSLSFLILDSSMRIWDVHLLSDIRVTLPAYLRFCSRISRTMFWIWYRNAEHTMNGACK